MDNQSLQVIVDKVSHISEFIAAACGIIKSVINRRRSILEVRWSISDRDGRRHNFQICCTGGEGGIDNKGVVEGLEAFAHAMLTSSTTSTHNSLSVARD